MLCNQLGMVMHYHKTECHAEIGVLPNRVGSPSILIKLCDLALLSETFMVLKAPALPASVSHGNSHGNLNTLTQMPPRMTMKQCSESSHQSLEQAKHFSSQ